MSHYFGVKLVTVNPCHHLVLRKSLNPGTKVIKNVDRKQI